MTANGWLQIILLFGAVVLLTKPLGLYMFKVFSGERTWLSSALRPVERGLYRVSGVDEEKEQGWLAYAISLLLFSLVGLFVTYILERTQGGLPLNPANLPAVTPGAAFNTAVSFTTNTNWQVYGGESTMSYLTQMMGLAVHNFTSAAAGIGVALALIRGISRRRADTVGNFWVDLTRSILYVLLPMSIVVALILVWQGVPQTLGNYTHATGLEGVAQTIARGPVASQIAIKQLGTNGGGFFNSNSAHPLENPTPFSNFVECLAIIVLPAALTYTYGRWVGNTRQGWTLFAAMAAVYVGAVFVAYWSEARNNPALSGLHINQAIGNMEGKEVRFGVPLSALWAVTTTVTSNGSVNSMHDSFNAIGGMVPLADMHLGEVIFGGVGTGLSGMLLFALLAVFLAGLMVGRTPEYLGKKVQSYEIKMVAAAILLFPAAVLAFTGVAAVTTWGTATLNNAGPHGFSEMLYLFTSQGANNGSAFAGIGANTGFYNSAGGFAMMICRFLIIIVTLAVAGSLARKQPVPAGLGTFPTTGVLWVGLLAGVVLIVGLLTFFPALALGPIAEHFMGNAGITF
ncbi:MAG TPA: potassium-transporting ATPase subunit KdpA [Dehalococcoidia bacterium]|jgi:K+-transporting ATPase ATPase A chain|nr:potassium-transporting ATPase subunit KdpA [Dehalococcoidia bacterium]